MFLQGIQIGGYHKKLILQLQFFIQLVPYLVIANVTHPTRCKGTIPSHTTPDDNYFGNLTPVGVNPDVLRAGKYFTRQ